MSRARGHDRPLRRFFAARRTLDRRVDVVQGWSIVSRVAVRSRRGEPVDPPAVVLLAGLGLSGRYLRPAGAVLAERHDVWIPDPPGFGASHGPRTPLDIAGLADAAVAWMDTVGLDSAAFVGNSMGCQLAVEIAARHPARASHIVLEAPTIDASARRLLPQLLRIARDALREPISIAPLQVSDWLRAGPRRLAATTRYMFAHHIEERLPLVSCPTLVIRGALDPIVPESWARQVAQAAPLGRLEVVEGGTHAMPFSNADVLAALIHDFVTGRSEPGTAAGPGDDRAAAVDARGGR